MTEATEFKHITLNKYGTPILAESNTNIIPIGLAHENGATEEWLLEQYGISRAQLYSALAYFYEHREEIREYQAETERLLEEHGTDAEALLIELGFIESTTKVHPIKASTGSKAIELGFIESTTDVHPLDVSTESDDSEDNTD